jgi:hypothetical protein
VLAVITFFAQDRLDLVQLLICPRAREVEGAFQDRGTGDLLLMPLLDQLKARRDQVQAQLDRWISRGFRGGGKNAPNATAKETAGRVSEVADLNRAIAKERAKERDG